MINNAYDLKKEIDNQLNNWNERSQFEIKGVGNLSQADLDQLNMYADSFIKSGGLGFNGLMSPMGSIKEVLDSYNIKESTMSLF